MSIDDKIFYNEASATKLGWAPEWFDCAKHGEKLVAAVAEFQKEHHLTADGCCGPATYRRLYNDRVANWDDHAPMAHKNNSESFIIYNSEYIRIDWPKVKLFFEGGGLKLRSGFKRMQKKRDPKFLFAIGTSACHRRCAIRCSPREGSAFTFPSIMMAPSISSWI